MFSRRVIFVLCAGLVSNVVFAAAPVPEMDISGVPVVLGLTIALVMLVRDRFKKWSMPRFDCESKKGLTSRQMFTSNNKRHMNHDQKD